MYGTFSIEDSGQPNPRQAEVDRTRDAAARIIKAKGAQPGSVTMDDVSLVPTPSTTAPDPTASATTQP